MKNLYNHDEIPTHLLAYFEEVERENGVSELKNTHPT
jgi:hypothetical protein